MTQLYIQDVTLRDGMHAIRHRLRARPTCAGSPRALDDAGVDAIEVAHGDGLAGSSLNYGPGTHDRLGVDRSSGRGRQERTADHAAAARASAPSTISKRAYDLGVTSVRIATHCTEADIAEQHIAKARELGMDVAGFLMMSAHDRPGRACASRPS